MLNKPPYLLAFLVYLLSQLLLFHGVVFDGMTFISHDIARFYYPMWQYGVTQMRSGHIPFWNPYSVFGSPFFANVQTCVFYPLTAVFYLGDFIRCFNIYILLHLTMASFFTFCWMRDIHASERAALLSGFAFGLSGYLMSTLHLTISLCSTAYFPLALLAFRRALQGNRFFWKGIAATVFLLQFLAGDPAILFISIFVCGGFAVYKTFEEFILIKKWKEEYLRTFFLILLLFLGLSAFQLLSFAEFVSRSHRIELGNDVLMKWSFPYIYLLNIVIPCDFLDNFHILDNSNQEWLQNAYCGLSVIFCAALVVMAKKRSREASLFILLALLGVGLSLGQNSIFYPLLHETIPFFKFVRYPQRFFFLSSFAVACLAGLGFDSLRSRSKSFFMVLLFLVLADLGINNGVEPLLGSRDLAAPSRNILKAVNDPGFFRVMGSTQIMEGMSSAAPNWGIQIAEYKDKFYPNLTLLFGLYDVLGYDSLYLKDSMTVVRLFANAGTATQKKLLDLLNVKYLSRTGKIDDAHVEMIQKTSAAYLYRNKGVLPRAYWVGEARMEKRENILSKMSEAGYDPEKTIFIEETAGKIERTGLQSGYERNEVSILRYEPNFVEMKAEAANPSWLYFSDTYYPGWKAWVDDKLVKVYRANYAFRSLFVPPGSHRIVWRYVPRFFAVGLALSLLSALLILTAFLRNGPIKLRTK